MVAVCGSDVWEVVMVVGCQQGGHTQAHCADHDDRGHRLGDACWHHDRRGSCVERVGSHRDAEHTE